MTLRLPPLAQYGRSLQSGAFARHLDVASSSSRGYLARLDAAQRAAAASLRRAIPEATVSRRFRIVLNGMAVELPARKLPTLVRLPFATRVYPSLRYTLALNRSPSVIAADTLSATTGARGAGVKIGVVDDGVDHTNPFLNPEGFTFPEGFPKGGLKWTSPKVIVARAFPGPGSGRPGRLAVDRRASFHGTHVAGIAAGNTGTASSGGRDHPAVAGLSGVAPRAWVGNYRVFNVPTPIGHIANTPEIVAAFEAAVQDGMDVINFSGGGPQTDPATDALLEAVTNVAAAGVVPVISAGNDRDEFGLGTAGSPGVAADAIAVAAVSNTHVFAPALTVVAPGAPDTVQQISFVPAGRSEPPPAWGAADQTLVDVGAIVGTDSKPVERRLCGPATDPNGPESPLPPRSLEGAIALVSRGSCTFVSKALRARDAGAVGLILVDNRAGEANRIPIELAVPAGMITDLDGARLREHMAGTDGRTQIRVGNDPLEIETGRSGVMTSFSSAGPTSFGHLLKPDVAAPGGNILSSTLPEFAGAPFAAFDGTSMAAPHVSGAAALLVERHPGWTPQQVKSALVATAGPAWADTARRVEAPVILQGGGLVNLPAADDPKLFTEPVSLSFNDMNVNRGARSQGLLVKLVDAGGGAGTWQVGLRPQSAGAGATLLLPAAVALPPGGDAELPVVARAEADAAAGDNYGFIVLRRGEDVRRIPYYFAVTRPRLESVAAVPLKLFQLGDTRVGTSQASLYRFPSAPFGPPPSFSGPPMDQEGAEQLYVTHVNEPVVNFGVAVLASSRGSLIDPWLLGSPDENDVQGPAGTPVNVNVLTLGFRFDVGAAGAVFPPPKRYFLSVDSGRNPFTGRSLAGRYALSSWVNDVFPPFVELVTTRVAAGRPLLVVRALDFGLFPRSVSSVDPTSLVIAYRRVLVGAAAYDPISGLAAFPLPRQAPRIPSGRTRAILVAADFQEAKNIATPEGAVLPNTQFRRVRITAVRGPAVTWLVPEADSCADKRQRLLVTASSTRKIVTVSFLDAQRRIATVRRGVAGLYATTWSTKRARPGRHPLRAVALDRAGASASAGRIVRVCR